MRRPAIAAAWALWAVTAPVGAFSLVVAAFRPKQLTLPVPGIGHGRTDTVGLAAIAASLALAVGARLLTATHRRWREVVRIMAVYAAVGWVYLATNGITHPATTRLQASHLLAGPTEGQVATACLVVLAAAVGVLVWTRNGEERPGSGDR